MSLITVVVTAASTLTSGDISRLTLAVLLGLAIYAAVCRWWPSTYCRKCDGKGRFRSPSGKNWRRCPRCTGAGSKERLGAAVLRAAGRALRSRTKD